ncbi:MAG: hypothetical protein ACNS62_10890 [Candidatus Cyclobacteriaceae bacterium M3_2C_046]
MKTNRRNFIKTASLATAGLSLATKELLGSEFNIQAEKFTSAIQIAPFNFLDEGIETVLDRLKNLAAIDTMFIYSHTYYGIPYTRTANVLAYDHGITQRDDLDRYFNPVWMKHDKKYFKDTSLWFKEPDPEAEHAGRDVFNELVKPSRERGMKIYARLLEPGRLDVQGRIANYDEVTSVDHQGKLRNEPCRNNPEFKAFMQGMVTDMFTNYELDGYQWGSERSGPLAEVLSRANRPGCFCEHCRQRARNSGIDPDRAIEGYTLLLDTIRKSFAGNPPAHDSVMNQVLHLFIHYPEILAWEKLWHASLEDLMALIYTTIKNIKPEAEVGRHIASNMTTLNPIDRAATDYKKVAEHADFIKPILYQDVMAARVKDAFLDRWRSGTLRGLSEDAAYDFFKAFNGYSDAVLPPLDEIMDSSLSAKYVYEETRRIVEAVNGKAAVYPGLGINVPHREGKKFIRTPDEPERIYQTVIESYQAGAKGVVASREYDEMLLPSLQAFGDAVREVRNDK